MQIGKLASATETSVETIRYYEREGILPRARRAANNYRDYGSSHLERLTFIRGCRALDMSLDEIRSLLSLADGRPSDCSGVNDLLDAHIAHVDERITTMVALRTELRAMREACAEPADMAACTIMQRLRERTPAEAARQQAHVRGAHRM